MECRHLRNIHTMAKRNYTQQALFGPLYAYLVVLSPPPWILAQLSGFKLQMAALADIGEANLHSRPHITLTEKLTDDADFATTVAQLLQTARSFPIEISGHGFFDHHSKKSVFVNVAPHQPILELMNLVKKKSGFPHLSLLKKLPPSEFEKLRPWLRDWNYSAQWHCTEVLVLRKLMSEKHLGFREQFKIPLQ